MRLRLAKAAWIGLLLRGLALPAGIRQGQAAKGATPLSHSYPCNDTQDTLTQQLLPSNVCACITSLWGA